jgi:hypothetical protein
MHRWGDGWFEKNGEDLNAAGNYIYDYCFKRARYRFHWKEKYGTLRHEFAYCSLVSSFNALHDIFYPGYMFYQFPLWFRVYIDRPITKVLNFLKIIPLIQRYQIYTLRKAYENAIRKFPHIEAEIMLDCELEDSHWPKNAKPQETYYDDLERTRSNVRNL